MVKVLNAGFYTTIQDLGRFGFQQYGVPFSGAMDHYSAILANAILNNKENDAVLEITVKGPKLQFTSPTVICITGANLSPCLNENPIELNKPIIVSNNDILTFGKLQSGIRTYLAVSGGFLSKSVMKSRSMYKNVTQEFVIKKNTILSIVQKYKKPEITHSSVKSLNLNTLEIEVFKGPEFDMLSDLEKEELFIRYFSISNNNNRMACQLNEIFENKLQPIITSLVIPGTVQLTPSGKLIILMRDCQATGGYPRVLQLSEIAINVLSQKFTNDKIQFKLLKL